MEAIIASAGYGDLMPVPLQIVPEQLLDVRFVFDDKDARHRFPSP
ncbi:hypothetical protein LBMAG53_16270 [Planctomycetota bacterium]|nr:hypothetical protein LBMAG53_16270 [Planctomycetota bacterium]